MFVFLSLSPLNIVGPNEKKGKTKVTALGFTAVQ